jgi:DNA-binding LacI/PurR family transcriptional regulator
VLSEQFLRQRGLSVFDAPRIVHADGVVLLLVRTGDDVPAAPSPVPLVVVNRHMNGIQADFVVSDDERGAYLATKHLLDLGHTSLAMITGPADNFNLARRLRGYRRALQEARLPLRTESVVQAPSISREGGQAAVRNLLGLRRRFTGVFCAADIIAIGALGELKSHGLDVPEDVSITSFDDETFAEMIDPPLTTVRKPRYQMGREAARLLMRRITGRLVQRASTTVEVSTELVKRHSAAPVRLGSVRERAHSRLAARRGS